MFPAELKDGIKRELKRRFGVDSHPQLKGRLTLDVSVQAQVLNLLADLRDTMRLAMIFISHDLGIVAQISDRVAVMYMGRTVETVAAREIVDRPIHPYTSALLAAMPTPDPNIRIRPASEVSEPPSQFDRTIGCP